MLRTKCIRADKETDDGLRISVMSRHTLNDGVTPDPTISEAMFDEWWQELAPPASLIGDYYRRDLLWADFAYRFEQHLDSGEVLPRVHRLAHLALDQNVTILCTEESPEFCHRSLIAQKCQLIFPQLITALR